MDQNKQINNPTLPRQPFLEDFMDGTTQQMSLKQKFLMDFGQKRQCAKGSSYKIKSVRKNNQTVGFQVMDYDDSNDVSTNQLQENINLLKEKQLNQQLPAQQNSKESEISGFVREQISQFFEARSIDNLNKKKCQTTTKENLYEQFIDQFNREHGQQKQCGIENECQQPANQPIEFKEFNLLTEIRGKMKQDMLEQQMMKSQELDRLSRQFRARPIPDYREMSQEFVNPNIRPQKLTCIKEFSFQTEQRAITNSQYQRCNMFQDTNSQLNNSFKARPCPNMKNAFTPKKSTAKMTVPKARLLRSEARAQQRSQFDSLIQFKDQEIAHQIEKYKSQMKEEMEKEVKEIRRGSIFKASGIKRYKTVDIQKSTKKLTEPSSPLLLSELRIQQKRQLSSIMNNSNQNQSSQC